jgi:hypothetical protein
MSLATTFQNIKSVDVNIEFLMLLVHEHYNTVANRNNCKTKSKVEASEQLEDNDDAEYKDEHEHDDE